MKRADARSSALDALIAFALGAVYVVLLLSTVKNLGYARDEGFYFRASTNYKHWFDLLLKAPAQALQQDAVDRYWRDNHEHPAFVKSLFALSYKFLAVDHPVFKEAGTAFRFPGMLLSALGVSTTYLWGRRAISRLAGFVAALLLAMQPAIFYHSHLACFDVAVLSMWLVTTYAYVRSLDGGGLPWALLTGVLYGFELDTKHNAWLLPPALVLHFLVTRGVPRIRRDLRAGRTALPLALLTMATIGPVVFYVGWPWIWFDTGRRLVEYVSFHVNHDYYNMEFLGVTYFRPPMPRLYAWVMTLATVPTITIVLFGLGLARSALELPFGKRARQATASERKTRAEAFSNRTLWALCLFTSYAPWLSPMTPIFGGTKHWITAYPFLCLFAGTGFDWVLGKIAALASERLRARRVPELALTLSVLAAPTVMTLHAHPWGLSAYVPLVGGTPGGASLGLNRSFWGYTTGAVQDFVNAHAPKNANVYVHDTALDSWYRFVHDGRLRADLNGTLALSGSDVGLYHHEQHMAKVEHELWVDYGTVAPATVGENDGVPIVWVFIRPGRGVAMPPRP
ncbi:MAG TPA: glycosyltransferase family 39 protein [Polyangiaceae bacterium]|nr:glycosyltransferase family 39 protein [Polyangiaceae bacterium]